MQNISQNSENVVSETIVRESVFARLLSSDAFKLFVGIFIVMLLLTIEALQPDTGTPLKNTIQAASVYTNLALQVQAEHNEQKIKEQEQNFNFAQDVDLSQAWTEQQKITDQQAIDHQKIAVDKSLPKSISKPDHRGEIVLPGARLTLRLDQPLNQIVLKLKVSGEDWCRTFLDPVNWPEHTNLYRVNKIDVVDNADQCKRGNNDIEWIVR